MLLFEMKSLCLYIRATLHTIISGNGIDLVVNRYFFDALHAVKTRLTLQNLLRLARLFLGQELQHLVVQADVVLLQVVVCLVFLEVNAEAGELFESFGVPAWVTKSFMELLLHRLCYVVEEGKLTRVNGLPLCLVATFSAGKRVTDEHIA